MKAKKTLIIIVVCSLVVVFGTSAFAEDWGWYECSIVSAGIGGARFLVQLNGTKISGNSTAPTIDQWFVFHSTITFSNKKVMIASILTALGADSKVEALVIPGTRESLYALYYFSK